MEPSCRTTATLLGPIGAGALSILFSYPCAAGAAWLTETGGADMGMAGAGRGAMSEDGAALAANPAAIGGLPATTITAALVPLSIDVTFQGEGATAGRASNQAGVIPDGSLFAVERADRLSLGFGAYSYLGLAFDFGDDWVGSRVIEEAGLRTVNIASAVAYQVTDHLHVGASLGAQYAEAHAATAVANDAAYYGPPAGLPDGRLKLQGSSWAPGGSLGLLYRPSASTSLGAAWTSPARHSMDMDVTAQGLHPVLATLVPGSGQVELRVVVPQQLTFSATRALSPATIVGVTAGWQDWSTLGQATLRLPGLSSKLFPDGLRDTWSVGIGIRHEVDAAWTLTAGVAYDSDPSVNGDMPAYFPVAEQWRVAGGVERKLGDDCRLRLALSIVNQGDVRVEPYANPLPLPGGGPLTGSFTNSRVYLLAVAADFMP